MRNEYLAIDFPEGYIAEIGSNLTGHRLGPRWWIRGPNRKAPPAGWIRSLGGSRGWEAWAGHTDALGAYLTAQRAADAVVRHHMNQGSE